MAVNEKPIYAVTHTMYGGKLFRPGERMDGKLSPEVVKSAQEGGVASDSSAAADRARSGEVERQRDVADRIANRSEKRDHVERERLRDIPRLVQMPDGSYARVERD